MNTLPIPGTHPGKTTAPMVVYEAKTGSLCVAIPVTILNSDVAWSGKHTVTLITSEGIVKEDNIRTLKAVFGDFGADPGALEEVEPGANAFDLVCELESYVPEGKTGSVEGFRVKYLNEPGGSAKMPESMDRKALLTKYGSKFKALSKAAPKSPAPATKAETKAPAKPAAPVRAAAGGPPSRKSTGAVARTCTQEECWTLFAKSKDVDEANAPEEVQEEFFAAQDAVREGANGEFSIQEWGQIATALGV